MDDLLGVRFIQYIVNKPWSDLHNFDHNLTSFQNCFALYLVTKTKCYGNG